MEIPQANIIQSGNQNMQFNGDNSKYKIENPIIEDMPELPEPNINYDMPELPEPDFITNTEDNEFINNTSTPENMQNFNTNPPMIKSKYNIFDMFWLINEDVFEDLNKLEENEAHFISISFNIDFGNLKITLCNLTEEAIDDHVLFRQNMETLISGTIYPSSAFRILKSKEKSIICMEQLINKTGEKWQKERPMIQINKGNDYYECVVTNPLTKENYKYVFRDWQKDAFEECLKYIYTNGLQLRGNQCLKKE